LKPIALKLINLILHNLSARRVIHSFYCCM